MKKEVVLIANDVRSCHNVGSLLRTAEGLGIKQVYLTGYTPYPKIKNDTRLPHLANKLTKQINKTALGAQDMLDIQVSPDVQKVVSSLSGLGYKIYGLEQSSKAIKLPGLKPPKKLVLIVGNETTGLDESVLKICDQVIEIPMLGQKESFNIVQATAMALYQTVF